MRPTPNSRPHRGLSIAEAIISLSISAMLLVAVAAAFTSSASAIENNDRFFQASTAARISIHQILAEVRRSKQLWVDSTSIRMITAEDEDRTYQFVMDGGADDGNGHGRLMLINNDGVTNPQYTLARNLDSMSFSMSNNIVSLLVTAKVTGTQTTLSGSAMQRRMVVYQ